MQSRNRTHLLLPLVLFLFLPWASARSLAGPAAAQTPAPTPRQQYEDALRQMLAGAPVYVRVLELPGKDQYLVLYRKTDGHFAAEPAIRAAAKAAGLMHYSFGSMREDTVSIWPLTFVHGDTPTVGEIPALSSGYPAPSTGNTAGGADTPTPAAGGKGGKAAGRSAAAPGGGGDAGTQDTPANDPPPSQTPDKPQSPPSPGDASKAAGDNMASKLNSFFGGSPVQALDHRLLIRGDARTVSAIRRMLAQWVDVPFAQVRLDVWNIETNTRSTRPRNKEIAQQKMGEIREGIRLTRALKSALVGVIADYIQKDARPYIEGALQSCYLPAPGVNRIGSGSYYDLMVRAGFDPQLVRPLSNTDILVFLAFADSRDINSTLRTRMIQTAEDFVTRGLAQFAPAIGESAQTAARKENIKRLFIHVGTVATGEDLSRQPLHGKHSASLAGQGVFPRLMNAYGLSNMHSTRQGISDFLYFWVSNNSEAASHLAATGRHVDLPASLSRASAAADSLLKAGMDALHDDLDEICMTPLLTWIRDDIQRNNAGSSGIDLAGNISIVVTSRQVAETQARAEGYFSYRRPNDFQDLVQRLTAAPTAATIFKGIPGRALDFAALFQDQPTVYNRVSPDVSLGVRPTVLRDGGSARLQINLVTNVDLDQRDIRQNGPPVDIMRGHNLTTDVAVTALDLFELGTFATDYGRPGEPQWRVPILEMVPLIGRYFQGPPTHEVRHQESLLIVNVSILPRSLDLAGTTLSYSP